MQERHQNRKKYFEEQSFTTQKYVIPTLEKFVSLNQDTRVLEIGCGEGGNMVPFLDLGCKVVGLDISDYKIDLAKDFFADHSQKENLELIIEDIYKVTADDIGKFDVIMMRDVIEHIPNQSLFLAYVKQFLKTNGKLFMGFPPWYMPFGGHQQVCKSKFLSMLPYFHILPKFAYGAIMRLFGETESIIKSRFDIKDTGITIERLDSILKKEAFSIDLRQLFLINPNYEVKFGLTPRKQFALFGSIPFIRNFVTTCCYYVISL